MRSPFPGMDPYIEACGLWPDFHDDLIHEIKRALAPVLPPRYVVRTGERAYVVLVGQEGKDAYPFIPDVRVNSPGTGAGSSGPEAAVAVAETTSDPEIIPVRPFIELEFRETFLEIHDTDPGQQLITAVEVLSPSNKAAGSQGRELYLRKRQGFLLGAANLVEMDLLHGGQRMPMLDPWPTSRYTILVCRRKRVPRCLAYAAHCLKPLPAIAVPLAPPDADLLLTLQPLIEAIYERSRYDRSIDYTRPLPSPAAEEAAWLEQQLRERAPEGSA